MPRRPLELQSLKWPFVGLAVLLAFSSLWAVYDEVVPRRPWKNFQREFFQLEEAHLKADRERAQKRLEAPETKQQLEAARAEFKAATEAISGNPEQRREYEAVLKAEEAARVKEDEAKLYLGFDKSDQDAVYYKLREARHENQAAEEARLQKEFDGWQRKIDEKTRLYNEAIVAHKAATHKRLAFIQRRDAAQAKIEATEKPIREIDKRMQAFSGLGKLPQMEQYWIENLRNSWGAPTVDRCQNCHVGINKGGYSAPWEVLEAKKANLPEADMTAQFAVDPEMADAYQKIHEAVCEDVPRPPDAVPIGGYQPPAEPSPMDPAQATECRPHAAWEKWMEVGEAYCGPNARWFAKTKTVLKDAKGAVLVEQKPEWKGIARNPALEAMEGEEKPVEERVAQACSDKETVAALEEAVKTDPFDVKPVFRTHPHRWELLTKAHNPETFGCTTCHGGQGVQTKGVRHRAFRHGEDDHDWNDPLTDEVKVMGRKYKGAFMQSKCDKCHTQQLTLSHAPLLSKGKKLFIDVGCWGCHPIEGYNDLPKRGPTLTNIASKTTRGWLQTWIAYPKGWRPATRMPNFWPGAVDANSVPYNGSEKPEEVMAQQQKLRGHEVSAIVAYLWSTSEKAPLVPLLKEGGDAEKGKRTFESVGCRACHVTEKDSAARRSEGSDERDYAPNLWNIGDKASAEWIYSWIKNPKAMWPETKMPDLRLSDAEAMDITAYLVGLRSDQKYPEPKLSAGEQQKLAAQGKELIGKYGCFGCHNIKGFENAQKIGTELTEHGRKAVELLDFGDVRYFTEDPKHRQTYANWVWEKLHVPRIFAYERVETRMPQFDFTDDEALAVLTFLKGQTGETPPPEYRTGMNEVQAAVFKGERLVFWNGCRNCHVVEKRGGKIRDLYNDEDLTFAPPVLTGEGAKVQPAWLFAFLKAPSPLRPWLSVRMPTFHFSDADATDVVHFFAAASNKSFPYLTAESQQLTGARAKEADQLFKDLQCINCHVIGQLRPGQDPGSAAPNLLLAKERLRPDWIPPWLKNPQALLEGTRMPSFWDFSDEAHPTSPSKLFNGDAKKQIDALRDYLMHLELNGAQPSKTASATPSRG
ncbi:MAG: c-type cytochrome [Deltaproteobacteria bacterium]|nr:MAG: c-type cytochrome [Deltaproteobacteria bacterium]